MSKEKFLRVIKKLVTPTVIKIVIFLIPVIVLIFYKAMNHTLSFESVFDVKTFLAIIIAFICQAIAFSIVNFVERFCEDETKLTVNYGMLIKKYERVNLLEYKGNKFPVEPLAFRYESEKPFDITVDHVHASKNYELPKQIAAKSDYMMRAHRFSVIYNAMNIRLDDLKCENGKVELLYSRTYYYDSLITNRAMDYRLDNGKTIRDIYEPGPFLNSLKDSKFSNHLGFNGFIELSNGKIIFIKRDNNLSIGKSTLGCSIGASLKSAYALEDDRTLSLDKLNHAIIKEIKNELNIEIDESTKITDGIFVFCRDVLEGGRPQFIFYQKLNLTEEDFYSCFKQGVKSNKKDKRAKKMDGSGCVLLTVDELEKSTIHPDKLIANGKQYKMMPLASASIVFLLKHLQNEVS